MPSDDHPLPRLPITAGKSAAGGPFRPEMTTNDDIFAAFPDVNAEKSMACDVLRAEK